jgi:hypothetical protein
MTTSLKDFAKKIIKGQKENINPRKKCDVSEFRNHTIANIDYWAPEIHRWSFENTVLRLVADAPVSAWY